MAPNYYDQYIRAEVVLPDWKGDKLIVKFRKSIKYDNISKVKGHYNSVHEQFIYTVKYPDGTT